MTGENNDLIEISISTVIIRQIGDAKLQRWVTDQRQGKSVCSSYFVSIGFVPMTGEDDQDDVENA